MRAYKAGSTNADPVEAQMTKRGGTVPIRLSTHRLKGHLQQFRGLPLRVVWPPIISQRRHYVSFAWPASAISVNKIAPSSHGGGQRRAGVFGILYLYRHRQPTGPPPWRAVYYGLPCLKRPALRLCGFRNSPVGIIL
jgi:hypothetical protein